MRYLANTDIAGRLLGHINGASETDVSLRDHYWGSQIPSLGGQYIKLPYI